MARQQLDEFTRAYIEAALWSTNDESDERGGEPLDANYSANDIAPETMELIKEDCADFQKRFGHLIEDDDPSGEEEWGRWSLAGHDFWLTREGHGAGFWDGDWPKHGDELTKAAKSYGGFDLYVGDDGLIYGPPADWYRGRHARRGSIGAAEAVPRPRRMHGRYRKPPQLPPRHIVVRDFNTIDELIAHAKEQDGATHVSILGKNSVLYYPTGRYWPTGEPQYEAGKVWQKGGYWHSVAPSKRTPLHGHLPGGTVTIESYLARSSKGRHQVRDYVPVDGRGRPLSGPTKDYERAKQQADKAGGYVKFDTGRPPAMEAWGQKTRWSDWEILDSIDRGQMVTPEAEVRAVKLAQLGFIDTTGTWRLTAKGRRVVDQRVPVAAEAKRSGRTKRGPAMTDEAAMDLAGKLAEEVGGNRPTLLSGGFRWSEKNASARFTTYSPEHDQKVVVVVSLFEDGSAALSFFSDEGLSGTATYESITHFTYGPGGFTSHQVDIKQMVEDINWVRTTVDGYAASWQQDETEVDERRRPRARRSTRSRR